MTLTTSDNTPSASVPTPAAGERPDRRAGPLAWGPPLRERTRLPRWAVRALAGGVIVGVLLAGLVVRPAYYAISPGSARQVDDLIRVEAPGRTYPAKGDVLFTTVSLGPVRNVYDALDGWLDPAVDVVPRDQILGPVTDREQYTRLNLQAMSESKEVAEYVAFRHLGYDVKVHGEGALVVGVLPGTGAAKALKPGDVVVAADGKPIALADDLVAVIRSHRPGESIALRVVRGDEPAGPARDLTVTLSAKDDGTPLLGVTQQTFRQRFDLPFPVRIDSGQVGGPSAGLAFTLALLDVLTPGELTGGARVAATGTIEADGTVGPVGGVAQKTVAVKRAGATLFLVPSEEYEVAKARAGDGLRVVKVDTLDEALRALATLPGSNALALGTPGAAPAS